MRKRIAILTGGGDVPGLNAAIKAIVWRLLESDEYEVIGLRRGWASLLNIIPDRRANNSTWIMPLNKGNTRAIDRSGGTILHTSRVNPSICKPEQVPTHLERLKGQPDERGRYDLTRFALDVVKFLDVDAIVALGGDGTLSFARVLHDHGVPLIAIPKTMDNDVYGTDYCLGFSTAVTRSVMFINDLRTGAGSHERFLVVELFGRYSGETCLLSSYLASVDRAVIAEVPFECERLYDMLAEDKRDNPSNYAVVAVSEGATVVGGSMIFTGEADAFGNRKLGGIGGVLSDYIEQRSRDKVIYQRLAYLMRSGVPDSLDQLVANNYGSLASDLIRRGERGRMVAVVDGRYTAVPIEVGGVAKKRVDIERFYDPYNYRPKVADVMGMPMFLH
jgi:ATP-dependent phosphofructokinase / diphosphate-dependent phosphofructokinase